MADYERDAEMDDTLRKHGQLGVEAPSRREFLSALATVGTGAVVAPGWEPPQRALNSASPRLIDVHHHVFPPDFVKNLETHNPQASTWTSAWPWTPQKSLAEMDRHGVATAIISIPAPGSWGEGQAARSLTRMCNEYSARLSRDNPGRFGFFAALPLPDAEGSLQEIGYAIDMLKADGVGLMTNYGDKYLGDPAFAPVLEELNRRKVVVHVHPMGVGGKNVVLGVPNPWAELPHETTRAVLSLLTSGSLVRLRDIRFIFSHAGGTIPMLAGRIDETTRFVDNFASKAPNGFEYELKRLHYDIAVSADPPAMAALKNLVPSSQIIFGSDYPIEPIAVTAGRMTKLGLSNTELQAIGHENASALFRRSTINMRTR